MSACDQTLLQQCFTSVQQNDTPPEIRHHCAVKVWFRQVLRCLVMTGSVVSSIDFYVEGHRVCAGTFAAVYSIPSATFNKIVLKGEKEWVTYNDTKTARNRSDRPTLLAEATTWWQQ
eukprot:1134056-Pleurochrysis_carterae.AAC.1